MRALPLVILPSGKKITLQMPDGRLTPVAGVVGALLLAAGEG